MASNDYAFLTEWRIEAPRELIYDILVAGEDLPRWWPDAGPSTPVLLACGVAFGWITLFCRVLPGELALGPLETLVRLTMPVIVFLGRLISPPIELFRRIVRIAGRSTPQEAAEQVADEILATVQEGERGGHLVEHQADMIEQMLGLPKSRLRLLCPPIRRSKAANALWRWRCLRS